MGKDGKAPYNRVENNLDNMEDSSYSKRSSKRFGGEK
jgi:hypothetical protein